MSSIGVAILSVSDMASAGLREDISGPTIQTILNDHQGGGKFTCGNLKCVPDDVKEIQEQVKEWVERTDINWIVTTGGTGFGVRDVTPEAITPLLERQAPGLVHLMLSSSLTHTPLAALSRPVAGTIGSTLVVTLPGSVRAVKENLQALLDKGVVGHAIELLKGGTGKVVHQKLAVEAGEKVMPDVGDSEKSHGHSHEHHHHHHHHHDHGGHRAPQPRSTLSHDPSAPVSARHRQSPYPILPMPEAFQLIENNINRLPIEVRRVDHTLRGHILATDVSAPCNVPRTPTTSVDGYALRSTDLPGTYKVLTSHTHPLSSPLPPGHVYRINTGGPLPAGADTVIMVEDTRLVSTHNATDGQRLDEGLDGEEKEIETLAQVPMGENVRAEGSDVRTGDVVLKRGEVIRSVGGEVGTLVFVGRTEVSVYRKPIVALLSTGNEIVDLHSSTETEVGDGQWGGIFDTNRPSLQAALEGMGYDVVDLGVVPDTVNAHVNAIQRGLAEADILLTTGGTSMGPSDLLKPVLERHFNGTIHFGRVSMKPGKPTTFATVPYTKVGGEQNGESRKPVFALPGNPASALVTFQLFVVPALRLLGGWEKEKVHLPRVNVKLLNDMYLDTRPEYHRVIISPSPEGLVARSTGGQRSSRVASLSGANGLAVLPMRADVKLAKLDAGTLVEAVLLGE